MSDQRGNTQKDSGVRHLAEGPRGSWLAPAALVLALLATGISIWAVVRPSEGRDAATTESLNTVDAKSTVCSAFDTMQAAVRIQTNMDLGPETVAREVVAANARLATIGGGQYLLNSLNPAVPPELGGVVRSFADALIDVGMGQLAGLPSADPQQVDRLAQLEALRPQIADLCG